MTTVNETFIPPASSNIEEVRYEPDVQNLTVVFTGGREYTYYNVPAAVYRQLTLASSTGQFVRRNIVGRYVYEQQ